MKKTLYFVLFLLYFALVLNGCTVQHVTRNEYFGYTNNPKHVEKAEPAKTDQEETDEWVNPLREDYDNRDNFQINYYAGYMPPYYMPVVVPWWDSYYSFYNRPFSGMYFRWGWGGMYDMYDWYSPFYAYCPIYYSPWIYHYNPWWDWYAYNYGHYYRPGHNHGWRRDYDHDRRQRDYAIRDFGPSRGTYSTVQKPYAGGSSSKSVRQASKSTGASTNIANPGKQEQKSPKIIYKPMTEERKAFETSKSSSKAPRSGEKIKNNPGTSNSGSSYTPNKSVESKPSGGGSSGNSGSGSSGSSGSSSKSSRSSTKTK